MAKNEPSITEENSARIDNLILFGKNLPLSSVGNDINSQVSGVFIFSSFTDSRFFSIR